MKTRIAKTNTVVLGTVAVAAFCCVLSLSWAGNLEPSAPPGPTMHTLEDIYSVCSSMAISGDDECMPCDALAGIFVKFDGVDGEVDDPDYDKWCHAITFSQGQAIPIEGATGSTRRRGDVVFDSVVLVRELDKASPKLAEAVCKRRVFAKVDIHLTNTYVTGRQTYYRYELKNAMVVGYSIGGSAYSTDLPTEEVLVDFEEIKVTYTEFASDGTSKGNIEYSWKIEEGAF